MTERVAAELHERFAVLLSLDRIGAFASSGFVGAGVDLLTMFALVEFAGIGPVVAKALTWELTVAVIFVINERWAFAAVGQSGLKQLGVRFVKSNLVRFGGFLVTLGALAVLVHDLGMWYLAANVIAIWIGFVVNYVFECLYTWKVHEA